MEILHKKNTAYYLAFPAVDSATPASFKSSVSPVDTAYYKDGAGSWTTLAITDTASEIGSTGVYEIDLTAAELNHDMAFIKFAVSGMADTFVLFRMKTNDIDTTLSVTLEDDAITSAKYDESTAYPVASADTGVTQIARVGADSDTLETLSDQIDSVSTHAAADIWSVGARALTDKAGFSLAADQSAVTIGTTTAVTNDVGVTQAGADKAWGTAARTLTAATNITSTGNTVGLHTDDKVLLAGTTHTSAVVPSVTLTDTATAVTNDVGVTQASADKAWGTAARTLTAATNITSTGNAVVLHTDEKVLLGGTTHTGAVIPTVSALTGHTVQTGDSYAEVNSGTYGLAQLVRSTTPANALDVNATGEAGIDLDNTSGTLAKTTDITGFNDISTADVNTQCDTALTDYAGPTKTEMDTAHGLLATPTQVNAQVADVMKTDVIAEQAQGVPPTTPTFEEAVMYLYMALTKRGDANTTGTDAKNFYNNAGTIIWKKLVTDDGTDYSEAKGITGA